MLKALLSTRIARVVSTDGWTTWVLVRPVPQHLTHIPCVKIVFSLGNPYLTPEVIVPKGLPVAMHEERLYMGHQLPITKENPHA